MRERARGRIALISDMLTQLANMTIDSDIEERLSRLERLK